MQKLIEKVMHLGIDFWKGFGGFLDGKWKHVGTHPNRAKNEPNFEERFFKKTLFFQKKNNDFDGSGDRSWM